VGDRKSCWWWCYVSWNALCTRSCCATGKFVTGI